MYGHVKLSVFATPNKKRFPSAISATVLRTNVYGLLFLGRIKDLLYVNRPATIADMKARITTAFRSIETAELEAVEYNFLPRINRCIAVGGHKFEHL